MTALRVNAPVAAAAAVLERYAELAGEAATIQANRQAALAATNAVADKLVAPLAAELDAIEQTLRPWWARNAAALTAGKRKSIELGGCMIGSRAGKGALSVADEVAAKAALGRSAWGKALLRVTVSIDRPAAMKALGGPCAKKLAAIGVSKSVPAETFFVERVDQPGTLAAAG